MNNPEVDQDPRIDEEFQVLSDMTFIDLYNRQEDLDPEFGKLIDKHFWELV